MLLGDILAHNARNHSGRPALSSDDVTWSHADLLSRVNRRAASLVASGVDRGDRVAILSHLTPSYVELLFAVTRLGAVLVPLNHLSVVREHETILKNADARFLLFAGGFEDTVAALRPELPEPLRILPIEESAGADPGLPRRSGGETALPRRGDPAAESDIALQIYTAGTSGHPRGAMLSHANLIAACTSAAIEIGLSRDDVFLSCTPLPLLAGIGRLLHILFVGGRIVMRNRFDPEEILRTIERSRITHVLLTPTMMAQILDLPSANRFNLVTLRNVLYGGATIPLDLLKRAIPFFDCGMVQSYDQVESSGVLTFLHPEDHSMDESAPYMRRLMSVGKEAIGVEVRLVDAEGSGIPGGQVGEVVARGRNIFAGYYKDPEFSAGTLRNGWLYTGDVASFDQEGYLFLLDRKRDVLKVGGISVYPREIEMIVAEHPSVAEVAVFPRPDYLLGEVPAAIVVLKEGGSPDADSLIDHCRRNMAPFKIPREIEFAAAIPRNSAGKVLKAKLKERITGRGVTR